MELANLFHPIRRFFTFTLENKFIFTSSPEKCLNLLLHSQSHLYLWFSFSFEWTKKNWGVQQDHLRPMYLPGYNVHGDYVKTHSTYTLFSNLWFYNHFVYIRSRLNIFQNIFGFWKVEVGEKVAALTFLQWVMRKMATMIFWKKFFYERLKTKSPPNVLTAWFMNSLG